MPVFRVTSFTQVSRKLTVYQAGVADQGNNDKIVANQISRPGYYPNTLPGSTFAVDASYGIRAKVHANK